MKRQNERHTKSSSKLRAAIYIRVSTLDQAREGYSLAAQRKTLEKYACENGFEVIQIYEDAGFSGKDINHRPAMVQLLDDAKEDKFDLIIFWALSRFTRSIVDLYQSIEYLNKYNVSIKSYTEPFDTSSVFGRFIIGILGLVAQLERELTAERVRVSVSERAAQGKRTCSEVLGYDLLGSDSLILNSREAECVRYIFDRYLEYRNLSAVAELCELRGFRGKRGSRFKAEHVKKILSRPIYVGYYSHNKTIFKGKFTPIVNRDQFDKVQKLLHKPTVAQRIDSGKVT